MKKCRVCNREAVEKYCEFHEKAYESVVNKYDGWRQAMEISWRQYLNEIVKNPYTGASAKEVAEELLKSKDA